MFTTKTGVVLVGQEGHSEGTSGSAVYSRNNVADFVKDSETLGLTVVKISEESGGYWHAIDPVDGLIAGEYETTHGGMIGYSQ